MTPDRFQNKPSPGAAMADLQALMRIRSLELRAKMVMEGFWHGLHRSPCHGFSAEFTEYRQYTPGDDSRYVDWKRFARSDRYYIKKFEDSTNLRCHLLVDNSRSMAYGSAGFPKAQYAATLAATLAYFLHQQGDAIGLMTFDSHVREFLPARHRLGHLRQIMLALEKPASGSATDIAAPLRRCAEIIRKRGLILVLSDFLAPLDELEKALTVLVSCGHDVVLFQVLDPAELSFGFDQAALFQDLESGREIYIDPEEVRSGYIQRLAAHGEALKNACWKRGIGCHSLSSAQALELALFDFLSGRMHSAKKANRYRQRTMAGA
jgi:uncharacterized protein (DUF58 family)